MNKRSLLSATLAGGFALTAPAAHAALMMDFSGDGFSSFTLDDNSSVDIDGDGTADIMDANSETGLIDVVDAQDPFSDAVVGDYTLRNWEADSTATDNDGNPNSADLFDLQRSIENIDDGSEPGELNVVTREDAYDFGPGTVQWGTTITPTNINGELDFSTIIDGTVVNMFDDLSTGESSASGSVSVGDSPSSLAHVSTINQIDGDGVTSFDATTTVPLPGTLGLIGFGLICLRVAVTQKQKHESVA